MFRKPRWIGLAGIVLCSMTALARADEAAELSTMLHQGRSAEAMSRAERYLEARPNDAAVRFLRGVMLMDAQRNEDAIEAFKALTQDFPDLPEPYNNLGVLLSNQGRYDEAREALEAAIRNNPGFAVAQENLGDVYVALAGRAYARSARLNPAGTTTAPKLALIRQLLAGPAS